MIQLDATIRRETRRLLEVLRNRQWSAEDIAKVTGATRRTVLRWRAETALPRQKHRVVLRQLVAAGTTGSLPVTAPASPMFEEPPVA